MVKDSGSNSMCQINKGKQFEEQIIGSGSTIKKKKCTITLGKIETFLLGLNNRRQQRVTESE